MDNILDGIVRKKAEIVAEAKRKCPLPEVKERIRYGSFRASQMLAKKPWMLIAECKLKSPVKGRLCRTHSVTELAEIYTANGAGMLSVHTDPHFLGCTEDFLAVRHMTDTPILRKDFIIDEYQIYESRMLGADAILLIARILTPQQLKEYVYTAWSLGMDVLLEVHDEADMKAALDTPAEMIGINNRNLGNFTTSIDNTMHLLDSADLQRTIISESGVKGPEDAGKLYRAGCKGILVGEGLVTAGDIAAMTRALAETAERVA